MHCRPVHDVWAGVHGLYRAARRRTASLPEFRHAPARAAAAGLDAQAGELREQLPGRFPQRASGSVLVSAFVRLAASAAAVLVGVGAVRDPMVFRPLSALSLLGGYRSEERRVGKEGRSRW